VLDIDAEIESGGLVRVEGSLDPFDYQRFADLGIDVRDMQLPSVTPMSVKFIGHPIDDGDVTLDLDYDIADRYLKATNHIEADDLTLGKKVEGGGLVKLPWKLGVALLKDKEGRITLDVPFEGSFATPGFGMATAAGAAAKEVFTELLKSPFRLLSRIGGSDQDLEYVEFAAGSALLEERAVQNLGTLSAALVERPTLALAINGSYDAEADGLALREAALREELLAPRRVRRGRRCHRPARGAGIDVHGAVRGGRARTRCECSTRRQQRPRCGARARRGGLPPRGAGGPGHLPATRRRRRGGARVGPRRGHPRLPGRPGHARPGAGQHRL